MHHLILFPFWELWLLWQQKNLKLCKNGDIPLKPYIIISVLFYLLYVLILKRPVQMSCPITLTFDCTKLSPFFTKKFSKNLHFLEYFLNLLMRLIETLYKLLLVLLLVHTVHSISLSLILTKLCPFLLR